MSRRPQFALSLASRLSQKTQRPLGGVGRRRFLVGSASLLALPSLELFHAEEAKSQNGKRPLRLAIYTVPNGRLPETWLPSATGTNFTLPQASAALEPFKSDLVFLSGLRNTAALASTEVSGAHARGTSGVSVCVPLNDLLSLDHNIISMDQLLAQKLQPDTRFPSLQFTAGEPYACDRGASCTYTQSISWAGRGQPLAAIANPLSAFNQLFGAAEGDTPEQQQIRQGSLKSVLDFLGSDATTFEAELGMADREKFAEYLDAVRNLERRVTFKSDTCEAGTPPGSALDYYQRVEAFHDLMGLAMQCDQSRIFTFMLEYGLSSRAHPEIGAPGGHHATSHYQNSQVRDELIKLETWQGQQMGKFCARLAAQKESDGSSLLDNTLVLIMPSMGHGNPHDFEDVSPVLVGKCGGALRGGQYQKLTGTPFANLHVTIMQAFGVQSNFGMDGTQVLSGILS